MTTPHASPGHDTALENLISLVLRGGVLLSGALIVLGGLVDIGRQSLGHAPAPTTFPHTPGAVVSGVTSGDGLALMSLGLLTLLATPILRVALSLIANVRERDWLYVAITAVVLLIIALSLFLGQAGA